MTTEGAPERPVRVLVIDDEEQIRTALRSVLRASHWVVDLAENGEAGLEAAATHTPDIVVLDLTLPDMSGFDVAQGASHVVLGADPGVVCPRLGRRQDHRARPGR